MSTVVMAPSMPTRMTITDPLTSKYAIALLLYRTHVGHYSLAMVLAVMVLLTRTGLLCVGGHTKDVHVFQSFQIPVGHRRRVIRITVTVLLTQMEHHSVEIISMAALVHLSFQIHVAQHSLV